MLHVPPDACGSPRQSAPSLVGAAAVGAGGPSRSSGIPGRRQRIGSRLVVSLALCAMTVLGCIGDPRGNEPGKVPITTSSRAALRDYLKARDLNEKLRGSEAYDYFLSATKRDPDFALAYYGLAATAPSGANRLSALQRAVQLVDRVSPGEACIIRAAEAGNQSDPEGQLQQLEALVKSYPNDERAHTLLGHLYFGRQQWQKAIAEYEHAIAIDPDFSPPYNQLGYAYRNLGEYDQAEKAFKRYTKLLPNEPNPYDSYAELLMKTGRFQESIRQYEKALDLDPNFTSAYVGMGNDYILLRNYDEARRCFAKERFIARTDGERELSFEWSAVSYLHQGDVDSGLAEIGKATDIAVKSSDDFAQAELLSLKAEVLLEIGRSDDAAETFAASLAAFERSPATPAAKEMARRGNLFNLARIALSRSDLTQAEALAGEFDRQVRVHNVPYEVAEAHELAGLVALARGDAATAVAELSRANQSDPRVLYKLGLAYEKAGKRDDAVKTLSAAANFNGLSLAYAAVRNRALAKLAEMTGASPAE
jgi:tetratricopeptide (TPR) repeat protein